MTIDVNCSRYRFKATKFNCLYPLNHAKSVASLRPTSTKLVGRSDTPDLWDSRESWESLLSKWIYLYLKVLFCDKPPLRCRTNSRRVRVFHVPSNTGKSGVFLRSLSTPRINSYGVSILFYYSKIIFNIKLHRIIWKIIVTYNIKIILSIFSTLKLLLVLWTLFAFNFIKNKTQLEFYNWPI